MSKWIAGTMLLALVAGGAQAAELAGVRMQNDVKVGDAELVLNGLGLRKKAIFKVYVAGLYLPERQSDAAAVLAADAPRRMVLQFLRGVSAGQMCGAWEDGLAANSPGAGAEVAASFDELCGLMADMEDGERMAFTYVPGTGTKVEIRGSAVGTLPGKPFADALFACWLGPEPPSEDLKEGILGGG